MASDDAIHVGSIQASLAQALVHLRALPEEVSPNGPAAGLAIWLATSLHH